MKEFHLADPDEIGSSEYRAIYNCLQDGLEACEAHERQAMAEAMLESFIERASSMLRQISKTTENLSSAESVLDEIPAEAAQQVVKAIREYMFEKDGHWQWRELSGADFIEFVTLLLSQHDLVPEGCE